MSARSAKSFSTCCARASLAALVVLLVLAAPVLAKKKDKKPTDPEELFNPLLGIEYSHWLVGPIAEIATLEEIRQYLALVADEDAQGFIEDFWEKRAEGYGRFEKKPLQIYEERAAEADKRYSEGAYPGRRTDRGKIFILFGEPEEVEYETPDELTTPTLEVWSYPKDAAKGLSGEEPKTRYRFALIDGSKVLYDGRKLRLDPNERRRRYGIQ